MAIATKPIICATTSFVPVPAENSLKKSKQPLQDSFLIAAILTPKQLVNSSTQDGTRQHNLARNRAFCYKICALVSFFYLSALFGNLLGKKTVQKGIICYTNYTGGDSVKIIIEIVDTLAEDEVVIRCCRVDETVQNIQKYILEQSSPGTKITFYKENREFYFPLDEVLFFETEGEDIYAHTANDAYQIKYRLYELEQILPRHFVRAAKSTIVNITQVYSITRNITASSLINFTGSHKHVYVSRHYYQQLRERLSERSRF